MSNNMQAPGMVLSRSPYRNEEYTVGWLCTLPIEIGAAKSMMDEEHGDPRNPGLNRPEYVYPWPRWKV